MVFRYISWQTLKIWFSCLKLSYLTSVLTYHCVPWLVIWSSSFIQKDKYIHNHCRTALNWGINKHYSISEATKLYFKQTTENPHGTGTPATVSISAAAASYPCLTACSPMKCVGQMCHIYSHTAPWLCLHKVCFYIIAHKKKLGEDDFSACCRCQCCTR